MNNIYSANGHGLLMDVEIAAFLLEATLVQLHLAMLQEGVMFRQLEDTWLVAFRHHQRLDPRLLPQVILVCAPDLASLLVRFQQFYIMVQGRMLVTVRLEYCLQMRILVAMWVHHPLILLKQVEAM
jgi:hypothetical protein